MAPQLTLNPTLLPDALQSVQSLLTDFAVSSAFEDILALSFGDTYDATAAESLRMAWRAGDFSNLPPIEVRTHAELSGAWGAYAGENNTVYLSSTLLASNDFNQIVSVLLEEFGHGVDLFLNGDTDSPGDEGAIFSALVQGEDLSETELISLKNEDDMTQAVIDGEVVTLERAILTVDDDGGGDYTTLNAAIAAASSGDTIVVTGGDDNIHIESDIVIAKDLTIEGDGNVTINANGNGRVFNIDDGSSSTGIDVRLRDMTITGGSIDGDGGGIRNLENLTLDQVTVTGNTASDDAGGIDTFRMLTITNSIISGNTATADDGGGIRNLYGTLAISNSTIANNSAGDAGGGVYNSSGGTTVVNNTTVRNNTADRGGAGLRNNVDTSTLVVLNSTLSGNKTDGSDSDEFGGAIANRLGVLQVVNSTLDSNYTAGNGGAISNTGPLTLAASTLSNNTAGVTGGGVRSVYSTATATIANSVIAQNLVGTSTPGLFTSANADVYATTSSTLTFSGENLVQNISSAFDGNTPIDSNLSWNGSLTDNGGATDTRLPAVGSPVIDAADDALSIDLVDLSEAALGIDINNDGDTNDSFSDLNDFDFDQRGLPRAQNGNSDLGAVETQPPSITTSATPSIVENTTFVIDINTADNNDSEGDGLTYAITGGADQSAFSIDTSTGELSFTTAPDFEAPTDDGSDNTYQVEVTVTDETGFSDSQTLTVSVTDDTALNITTSDTPSVAENTTFVIDIHADDNNDSEGNGLTYAISGDADQGRFSVGASTGELSFRNAPDFDNPTDSDSDNIYEVEVSVADTDGETEIQSLSVTVTDVDDANLVVTILEDISNNDFSNGDLSLREALSTVEDSGTITFDETLSGETIVLGGSELTIDRAVTLNGGTSGITIDANNGRRVFNIDDGDDSNDVSVTLSSLTITGGSTNGDGGGIYNRENLTLTDSTVSGNYADDRGGGIYNYYSKLTLINSTIRGNSVDLAGGGIANRGSAVSLTNSTVSGNSATDDGGGIFNRYSTLALINSTVSGNAANDNGGGIYNRSSTLTLANSTLTGNSANDYGGGIFHRISTSTLTLTNSLIAGNEADADANGSGYGDEFFNDGSATVIADGNNLFGHRGLTNAQAFVNLTPGASDITATRNGTNTTALARILDTTLADNGGPTQTHALIPGSPAINAGNDGNLPEDDTDLDNDGDTSEQLPVEQRRLARISGSAVDIGAVETVFNIVVDTLEDEDDGDLSAGDVSLREALTAIAPGGTITFASELATTDAGMGNGVIGLNGTQLNIIQSVTINGDVDGDGNGDITVDAQFNSRVFNIDDSDNDTNATVNISGLTIRSGSTSANGAGIYNRETLTLADSTLFSNFSSGEGGGIYNRYSVLNLINSTVSTNSANINGGGIYSGTYSNLNLINSTVNNNSTNGSGGGIHSFNSTTTLTNSTVSGNSADNGSGILNDDGALNLINSTISGNTLIGNLVSFGGGILNDGGALNLTNSTVSGNLASIGGGIVNNNGTISLTNSTISGNAASIVGGIVNSSGSINLTNSLIAGNGAVNLSNYGTVTANANNLFGDSSQTNDEAFSGFNPDTEGTSDLVATSDGNLGNGVTLTDILDTTLQYNGGLTQTHALVANSPALDAGNNASIPTEAELGIDVDGDGTIEDSTLSVDQRGDGFDRVRNGTVDIGAFELQNDAPTFDNLSFSVDLSENSPAGTTVGIVSATDDDAGDSLTYAITAGNDSGTFAIDETAGTVTVADANALDFETNSSFELTVTASDSGGLSDTAMLSINLQDVADNLVVNTNEDGSDNSVLDGSVTLRDALTLAEAGGTITFDESLAGDTIVLGGTALTIDRAVTIDGEDKGITLSGDNQSRVFTINDGDNNNETSVFLSDLTIAEGTETNGGGILNRENLILTNSIVSGNEASNVGGGIYNRADSTLTLTNSILNGNKADESGGGMFNTRSTVTLTNSTVSGNSSAAGGFGGGGIFNYYSTLTLTNSTLSGNEVNSNGGGMFNYASPVTLINSTVSSNFADDNGGGIFNAYNDSVLVLTDSTFSNNSANRMGGGIYNRSRATVTLTNSLIVGNDADGTGAEIVNDDATVNADSNNLFGHSGLTNAQAFDGFTPDPDNSDITATSDGTNPTALVDILDTTLQDNGGPTQTHALVAGSPALDAGDNTAAIDLDEGTLGIDLNDDGDTADILTSVSELAFDQRGGGFDRIRNGTVDIGAFELQIDVTKPLINVSEEVVSTEIKLIDGTYDSTTGRVTYRIRVQNTGNEDLDTVTLTNDFTETFDNGTRGGSGPDNGFEIVSLTHISGVANSVNPDYDGGDTSEEGAGPNGTNDSTLIQSGALAVGEFSEYEIVVDVNLADSGDTLTTAIPGTFLNSTTATGLGANSRIPVSDISNDATGSTLEEALNPDNSSPDGGAEVGISNQDPGTLMPDPDDLDNTSTPVTLATVDLVATDFDVTNDHVLLGDAAITYTIANNSSQTDATSFDVHIVYSEDATIDIDGGDEIIGTFTVGSLAAGDELTGSIEVTLPTDTLYTNALADDPAGKGSGYVSSSVEYVGLVIDHDNTVVESDESNNSNLGIGQDMDDVTYFPWDIDSSGQITATDVIYAINRLGAETGDSNYDSLVDFDGSGQITATDVISSINRLGYSINENALLT